jgi:hypothetical protein
MKILSSRLFNYYSLDDDIIMFQKKNKIKELENDVVTLASNTVNTWQKNRNHTEIVRDTKQGKIAESMFIDFISFFQSNSRKKIFVL